MPYYPWFDWLRLALAVVVPLNEFKRDLGLCHSRIQGRGL
jgi:hypothetical protein